jgi:hypothetical protein
MRAQLINFLEKKFPRAVKLFLVVLFLYFVSMMIVMGNGASFLGRYLSSYYTPIANTIGLNTTWNFFSPDPANTMYINISYTLVDGTEIHEILPAQNEAGEFDFSLQKRRLSYVVRFLIIDPQKIEQFLAPWLCKQKQNVQSVYIETVIEKIPPIDKVITLKDTIYNDLIERQTFNTLNYNCSDAGGESS